MQGAGQLICRPLQASVALCAITPSLALAARASPRTHLKTFCKQLIGTCPALPSPCLQLVIVRHGK